MTIFEVKEDKKRYLELLLLGDEQEDMIDRYLERGRLFCLREDGEVIAVCVITEEADGVMEIKNLAVAPSHQRRGYGRALVEFVARRSAHTHRILQVGTGESPVTLPFYFSCGFVFSHRVENFFVDNYDHPIFEAGVQLRDMIYLRRNLDAQWKIGYNFPN